MRCLKGYTSTAVGFCIADLVDSILRNVNDVKSVSTLVQVNCEIFACCGKILTFSQSQLTFMSSATGSSRHY